MTRNKKEKEKKEDEQNIQPETDVSDNSEPSTQKEDIKQIEGKEPFKLEFFSKNDLIEKVELLEKNLAEKEVNLQISQKERSDWKDKYTRLQAEFENAQKRWNKNRDNLRIQFTASVLKSFLPLYDSFKKALSDNDKNQGILKGFYDQFMNILKSYKAEPINVNINDSFDYNYHEALSSLERDDVPNNTILEIIQDGWKLDKDVIRFTKVIISREPKPPEPEEVEAEASEDITGENEEKEYSSDVKKQDSDNNQEETKKKDIDDSPGYIS